MPGDMSIEKRRHIRIDSENLSHVAVEDGTGPVGEGIGKTLNISESGILLETHFPVETGQGIDLTLALAEELIDLKGEVVHSRVDEKGVSRTGIRFKEMDAEGLRVLKQFVVLFRQQQSLDAL
jgi:c-di-GMP-binding flagellar brake protein YcgR